jgi:hypothetical protein
VHHIRITAALAVASGVAVASLAAPAAATTVKTVGAQSPSAAAAAYLVRNFKGNHHDHLTGSYTSGGKKIVFAQDGETADAILSLDAAGVAQHAAKRATKWLEKDQANYVQIGDPAPDYLPGSLAKLLLVATAQHVDPHNFAGADLISELKDDEGAGEGTAPGQFQDPGETSFGSSVVIQSLAVLALANTTRAADQPSDAAVSFLAGQQCSDGGFVQDIRADTGTACDTASEQVDATGYAVQALVAAGQHVAATKALTWLAAVRNDDGGWGTGAGKPSNANSTALAVEGLRAAHATATKAERWLAAHQLGCSARAKRRGAVTVDGTYSVTTAVLASSQAGVALAGKPMAWVDNDGASRATPTIVCPRHTHA